MSRNTRQWLIAIGISVVTVSFAGFALILYVASDYACNYPNCW